jgi:hypothetical protein
MGAIGKIIGTGALMGALFFGYKAVDNAAEWHSWDKHVTKHVEVANGAMTAAKKEGVTSMEESLDTANANAEPWTDQNPGIIWPTSYSDVNTFRELTEKAARRSQEIGQLESALSTGILPTSSPVAEWVRATVISLDTDSEDSALLRRLAYSEKSGTIASSYEALNDVIAGGSRVSGEKVNTEDRSLVYILDRAGGWRSIVRFQGDDYKTAAALTKVAVIDSNMGHLPDAIENLEKAHTMIEHYPDSKNLAIWRDVATMNQGTLERSMVGAVQKLKELDDTNPVHKYSEGWWDRVAKLTESIGGQETPCLTDLSDNISSRYSTRLFWDISLLAAFGAASFAGFYSCRDSYY